VGKHVFLSSTGHVGQPWTPELACASSISDKVYEILPRGSRNCGCRLVDHQRMVYRSRMFNVGNTRPNNHALWEEITTYLWNLTALLLLRIQQP